MLCTYAYGQSLPASLYPVTGDRVTGDGCAARFDIFDFVHKKNPPKVNFPRATSRSR